MTKRSATTTTPAPEMTEDEVTYTAKEMAALLDTDPKSFRRFLRSLTSDRAGKGGRWTFDEGTAAMMTKAWETRSAKATAPTLPDADEAYDDDDELEG